MATNQEFDSSYQSESLPMDDAEVRARHESNRAGWNEGARYYKDHLGQAIQFLRDGHSNLHPVERNNLGDLRQYSTAIHLQCASGRDTISLWLEGVKRIIGVDISDVHIENARRMSAALNVPAEWFRCDVLDTPHTLDGIADLVYTGRGAINWLQDLDGWAEVIYRLLKPGGLFHLLDDHPMTWLFDQDAQTFQYAGISYFAHAESSKGWPDTYIGDTLGIPAELQTRKYERLWTLSDVVNAIRGGGLTIEYLGEHADPYWNNFPHIPCKLRGRIPMTFSIMARRP